MEVKATPAAIGYSQPIHKAAPTGQSASVGESAQILLLKKLLEAQQEQAAILTQQSEGKGKVLDIRV